MSKSSKRLTIAVDMDGVLADSEAQFSLWYERETGITVDRETFIGVPEDLCLPDKTAVRRYVHTPQFFRTLPRIEGGVDALKKLMIRFDVYIVSAAMEFPLSLFEKKEWLEEYFPFISWRNICFCGDKSIINTDYLIDDHIRNLDNFRGTPLLFSAAHNAKVTHHVRHNNWAEILNYFEKIGE